MTVASTRFGLAVLLLLPLGACRANRERAPGAELRSVVVESVRIDLGGDPVVTLLEVGGRLRRLPILVGRDQAESIHVALSQISLPRPNTHDLMVSILGGLGRELERIAITELRNSTYYARIELRGERGAIDARPSDAIALALRTGAPILVAEEVLARGQPGGDTEGSIDVEFRPNPPAPSLLLCSADQSRSPIRV